MSRYELRGREPHTGIAVGWDPPLATYFAQVWDDRIEDEEAALVLWVGCSYGEIATVAKLAAILRPFVALEPGLIEQLLSDADGRPAAAR